MQTIKIHSSSEDMFFCPVNGQQITFEDDYRPSDANRFTYLQDWISFAYVHDSLLPILESLNLDAEHVDLDEYDLFKAALKSQHNFMLFSICDGRMVVDHCIEMGRNYESW